VKDLLKIKHKKDHLDVRIMRSCKDFRAQATLSRINLFLVKVDWAWSTRRCI